ncbi:MAG TPA: LysM peptidoglycan-binding domain-containing protein [Chloroflexi bacterium]|nr:LysM peptidoglycan-binding domain-containing protein [Chloroflexota bacterium]
MRARTWAIVITVNVILSAAVMLGVLLIWDRIGSSDPSTPTPALVSTPAEVDTGSSAPLLATPPSSTPGSLTHIVQAGDTLSGIAQAYGVPLDRLMTANGITNPDLLQVGQALVIPLDPLITPSPEPIATEADSVDTPLPTSPATLTPSGPPLIEIGQVLGGGDLAAEVIVIRNMGGMVHLKDWTLSNAAGDTFIFPDLVLFPSTQLRVHSPVGRSTPTDLYWGRDSPAWSGGVLITLRDSAGNVVDTYIAP